MGNVLNLHRSSGLYKLKSLSKDLFDYHQVLCKFIDIPVSSVFNIGGQTYTADDGRANLVEINTYAISHSKRSIAHPFNPSVSDEDFAKVVLNMYHEQCHCIQKNDMFRKNRLDGTEMRQLMQEVACRENPDYYINDGNYTINSNEIQAEYYGIISTYEYLCSEFPDVDPQFHEDILVNIVNDKTLNSTYFIKSMEPFSSLSEIETAFDKVYDDSFDKKCTYFVNSRNTGDCVKKYMQSHKDAKDTYLGSADAFSQDKCVSTINLMLHSSWQKDYVSLKSLSVYSKLSDESKAFREKSLNKVLCNITGKSVDDSQFDDF